MMCTIIWAYFTFTAGAVVWRKPIQRAEAHDVAKIHGDLYTRYNVAVSILFLPSFTCTADSQEKQFSGFDNGRATHLFIP